ncbi:MAG: PDZ domain-containing protein [Vicingaceae bacterium]
MKRFLFVLTILLVSSYELLAVNISYVLNMEQPQTHYFDVEMKVEGLNKAYFDVKMPVWAPGSYLIREFAKNVEGFSVNDSKGNKIKHEKIDKNTWRIYANKQNVSIKYKVYAFEISVRTSFLNDEHGYVNGTSVFMFVDGYINHPVELTINPYKDWKKISTALTKKGEYLYTAANYDDFVDCPIEIGNHVTFDFNASGVLHHVAMFGKGNYDIEKLKVDMAKVVTAATNVFGENPNKEYTFIIHNLKNGSGGLEHKSSTTLQVNRWTYEGNKYLGFLSLVAHEYFHLWNVKRIRPKALGPFDYNKENYTHLLWVMEGFTSYYDELLLLRAGFYNEDQFVGKEERNISSIENQPGNKIQPVAMASFDAWIKAYRPNENSYNSTISYYPKGHMLACLLDLEIIHATNYQKKLDDLLQYLYKEYYKKQNRGFTSAEFKKAVETIVGKNMDEFFDNYVYDTKTPDYKKYFGYVGIEVKTNPSDQPSLGISISNNVIQSVVRNSSAYEGGLNVNDELIAINGYRVTDDNLSDVIERYKVGDKLNVTVVREEYLKTYEITLKQSDYVSYSLVLKDTLNEHEKSGLIKWLSAQ